MISKEEKKLGRELNRVLKDAERSVRKENYENAAALYKKASLIAHKIGDRRSIDYALEAVKYNLKIKKYFNVGWSYRNAAMFSKDFKDLNNAVNFSLKAIPYFSRVNSLYAVQWCYNLAGEASEEMKDYLTAAKYYRKSLEIERKKEVEKKLDRILKEIPHPTVEQYPERRKAKEGEDVVFGIKIRNESPVALEDLCLLNNENEKLCSLDRIGPGEEKTLSLKVMAENVGSLPSPVAKVQWKTKGKEFTDDVEPVEIPLKPNIEIKPYMKNKPGVGQYSYFVISVKNNSPNPITNVKLNVNFPLEFEVKPITGYSFDEILGNEEKGFVFKILPTIVGKTRISPEIVFKDTNGEEHEIRTSFILEEILEPPKDMDIAKVTSKPPSKESLETTKKAQEFKRYLSSVMVPLEISEPEYVSLAKRLHYVIKGYTLKDIDIETVSKHVLEECKCIKLAGTHKLKDEALYLFSGESIKEKRIYLLTVVVKQEGKFVHLAFKLHSDRRENLEELVSKIAEVIKHAIVIMSLATEVEKIEVKKTINIIDSIVQRSDIGTGEGEDKEINVKDSVVQRTEL